jgi:hypothetical protein
MIPSTVLAVWCVKSKDVICCVHTQWTEQNRDVLSLDVSWLFWRVCLRHLDTLPWRRNQYVLSRERSEFLEAGNPLPWRHTWDRYTRVEALWAPRSYVKLVCLSVHIHEYDSWFWDSVWTTCHWRLGVINTTKIVALSICEVETLFVMLNDSFGDGTSKNMQFLLGLLFRKV